MICISYAIRKLQMTVHLHFLNLAFAIPAVTNIQTLPVCNTIY